MVKKYGGKATLIDYCDYALENSKKEFEKAGIKASFMKRDIFNLDLNETFSLVHSEGLLEHFYEDKRFRILEIHANLMAEGGYLIIFVPSDNRRYRFVQKVFRFAGINVEEKPFTEEEFLSIANKYNLQVVDKAKFLQFWIGFLLKNNATN
jgi:predicted SAM-dependent methyltransferase